MEPDQAAQAERVNRRFAGGGTALGLILWYNLFQLPGAVSIVANFSYPRVARAIAFAAMLLVVPGTVWLARKAWGADWRRAFPLRRVHFGVFVWTLLGIAALLAVDACWFSLVELLGCLPKTPDPFPTVGIAGITHVAYAQCVEFR